MKELELEATVENLDEVLAFVDKQLEEFGCPMKTQMQVDIAVEEIFVNIAKYAYGAETGKVTISVSVSDREATIEFRDSGVPFNPLEKADPDVTLSAEERNIGGLGIYLVKKNTDGVTYQYQDNQNVLTLKKLLQ